MTHPIGERDLVEQTASKKSRWRWIVLGAGFMLAGRRTKPSLRLVNCLFSSTSLSKPICSIHMLKQDFAVGTELNSSNLLMNRQ